MQTKVQTEHSKFGVPVELLICYRKNVLNIVLAFNDSLLFNGVIMSTTDWIYLAMLLGSIPYGHLVKLSGSPARKQFLCMAAGIGLSFALVGVGIVHSFVAILGTYLIVLSLGPR